MPMADQKQKSRAGDHRLSSEDRTFLSQVTETMFLNPFNEDLKLLQRVIPDYSMEHFHKEHFLWTLQAPLSDYLSRLAEKGIGTIQAVRANDRALVENAFLLQVYLEFVPAIDQLVQRQLADAEIGRAHV